MWINWHCWMILLNAVCIHCVLIDQIAEEDLIKEVTKPVYGYRDEDVTHGVGFGHHLHPFYYRSKPKKYYDCATGEDWKPFENAAKDKVTKPIKKYVASIEKIKFKPFKSDDKEKVMMQSRSDSNTKSNVEQEHAKLVRDINEMLESDPRYRKFRLLPEVEPIRVADEFDEDHTPSLADLKMYNIPDLPIQPFNKQTFKKHQSAMPFQKYKKFKVNMKPKRVVLVKYTPPKNSFKTKAFRSKQSIPTNYNQARHIQQRLKHNYSVLEQFLLLFPKLK